MPLLSEPRTHICFLRVSELRAIFTSVLVIWCTLNTNTQVKKVVSIVAGQESRLQEELLEKQGDLFRKQGERLGQLHKSLKDQGKLSQDQMLSKIQASQLEEKSHLAAFEEKLHQLDGKLVAFGNASSGLDSEKIDVTNLTAPAVNKKKTKVKFTTIQNVGLSFALIMEPVKNSKKEQNCAQLVDSGRLIVLDSKSKMEKVKALKTNLTNTSEKKGYFYVGLKKQEGNGRHLWTNGKDINNAFWTIEDTQKYVWGNQNERQKGPVHWCS